MMNICYLFLFLAWASAQSQPSCDSKVYCQGNLLHTIQMARIFNDSKTFVDLKMLSDENTTLKNFEKFMNETQQNPSKKQIEKFIWDNFENFNEFDNWIPTDFTPVPQFLQKIDDEEIRNFAKNLVNIWPTLARKIKKIIQENPELTSLIPVQQGFMIPGGRFREFYYWDSYWIIKGLLLSEMHETVRGMLDNFFSLVERFGFIPNGARVYYLNRSQPPLLTIMAAAYFKSTNDTIWLQSNIKTLDKELRFWLKNKLTEVEKNGVIYTLAHYDSESGSPRPESYFEDIHTASYFSREEDKIQMYADLKSGAESGLDFSSRWIVDENGTNNGNITMLQTRRIIPVDLNAILCQAFRTISEFYVILNDFENAIFWTEKASTWVKNIEEVFYNEEDGIWYDWDSKMSQPRRYFFPSNFAPLWAEAYNPANAEELGQRAADYFINMGIMEFEGGIPASLSRTGEQWDYPNAWPPLQEIVVLGLDRSGNCKAKNISREFAHRWVQANIIGFNQTNEMFEKYDAEHPGQYGGGGEYVIQTGFGWTNGVALSFIDHFYTSKTRR